MKVIAIDFDGTLCENRWPAIGAPKWNVINKALKEKEQGAKLILVTMREGQSLDEALSACTSWGLSFDAVNDNLESWQKRYHNNPRKIGATEYWDDRAIDINKL